MKNQEPTHKTGSVRPAEAVYQESASSLYRGNPLIEALPIQPDDRGLYEQLEYLPEYNARDRKAPANERQEMLEGLKFFFQPLPRHLGLAQGIFKMIRVGYAARNPIWGKPVKRPIEDAMESSALLGSSGIGKTQSVRHVLGTLKNQVIHHSHYNGQRVDESQVLWLRVECPHDASPRGLCISFFERIDELLGTDYRSQYATNRGTVSTMIPGLTTIAREHYLGLLVIDEIQNLFIRLCSRSPKVSSELRDFIVRIINDLRIPVLMVGTAATANMLAGTFRVTRRCTGLQEPFWGRLKEEDIEWKMFMNELWTYRYTTHDGDNYDTISKEIYDLTFGIPDLVVKLFYLAQMTAINTGTEKITVDLLRDVSTKSLVLNQRHLDDIRAGKLPAEEYQYEKVWERAQARLPVLEVTAGTADTKTGKKERPKQAKPALPTGPIINLLGTEPGETVYDALKRQGNVHNGKLEEVAV